MNKQLGKILALLTAFAIVLSLVPGGAGQAGAAAAITVPDGEYPIHFRILKDGSEEDSYASAYLEPGPGKLIVKNGKYEFVSKWNNYDWFAFWGSLKPGRQKSADADDYTPATPISAEDHTVTDRGPVPGVPTEVKGYYGTISLPVEDITKKQELLMHIVIKDLYLGGQPFAYDHWYNAQLLLDTTGIPIVPAGSGGEKGSANITKDQLNEKLSVAQQVYETTEEGLSDGLYYPGSKTSLYLAIAAAREAADDPDAAAEAISKAYDSLVLALENYELLRVKVDRTPLQQIIGESTEYLNQMVIFGSASGDTRIPSAGEHPVGSDTALRNAITSAESVYSNPGATIPQVDKAVADLSSALQKAKNKKTTSKTIHVALLDSVVPAPSVSKLAYYVSDTAELLQSDTYLYARVTWNRASNLDTASIKYKRPATTGEFAFLSSENAVIPISANPESDTLVSQIDVNRSSTLNISGIVYVKFNTIEPSVTNSVYLTLNVDLLTELAAQANEAQALLDGASAGAGPGQYPADAVASFRAAIDSAKAVANNLGATRPQIDAASAALEQAVAAFKASAAPENGEEEDPPAAPVPPDPPVTPTPPVGSPVPVVPAPGSGTPPTDREDGGSTGAGGVDGGASAPAKSFRDIHHHWARETIEKAAALGIAQGFEDGSFRPDAIVTRAEFAAFLSRALQLEAVDSEAAASIRDLNQMPAWARSHAAKAASAGLMKGYADGAFGAGNPISRAEIAVIAARAAKLAPKEHPVLPFADAAKIPAWAKPEIAAAVEAGLIQGKDGNRFDPDAVATRAEALAVIVRLLERP